VLSVASALEKLLKEFSVVKAEPVALMNCRGRILAEDVRASFDLPLFTNSSMDGFAVKSDDVRHAGVDHPVELSVIADIPAGLVVGKEIKKGQAIRIMTGAVIPKGCDAVVPIEDTNYGLNRAQDEFPWPIQMYKPVNPGDYLRVRGQDVHAGEVVLTAGTFLRPQELGFLGMLGFKEVLVYRRPKVAILSTGDELVKVGSALAPGKIYDANSVMLAAQIVESGGEFLDLGIAKDKHDDIYQRLEKGFMEQADLIVSSAGVSVGAFDLVRQVIEEYGSISFWRVNMRPGKPLAFGNYRGIPFVGLPGNPVSAFVGFDVFVQPAIAKLSGNREFPRPAQKVKLDEEIISDGRESYLRGIVYQKEGELYARLTGHQGSGNLRSLVQSNAFLIVPSEVKSLPIGAEVNAWITGVINQAISEDLGF
jgi:molybdopterin molybdotransferase